MEQLLDFVTPGVLLIVAVLVVFFIISIMAILRFHWKEFSVDAQRTSVTYRVFAVVAGVLTAMMLMSILFYGS